MKTNTSFLDTLKEARQNLLPWLEIPELWNSLYVDYDMPYVERLWLELGDYRLSLHIIHPCDASEALLHPHPWPSAMHIVDGVYEMGIGFAHGDIDPPIAAKVLLSAGDSYEMTHIDGWHYVRPIDGPVMTIMLTGQPWERESPKSPYKLSPLSNKRKADILRIFCDKLKQK